MIRQKEEILQVKSAKYVDDYKLQIIFSNKKRKRVDFAPFLKKAVNPMTVKYRNKKLFKNFCIEHGDLFWGDYEMIFPVADLYEGKIE